MKNITFLDGDFVGLGNLTTFVISCTVLRTCASGQLVHFKIHVLSLLPLLSFFGCLVLGLSANFLSCYLCGFFLIVLSLLLALLNTIHAESKVLIEALSWVSHLCKFT